MNSYLLTTKQVAEKLKCSTHHVTKLRKKGLFNGFKISKSWMYLEEDILAYICEKERGKYGKK